MARADGERCSAGARPPDVIAADRPLPPAVADWAATSLTCHLGDVLPRLLLSARYAPVPGAPAGYAPVPGAPAGPLLGFSHGGEPPWGNRVDALALVREAERTGDLHVTVGLVDRVHGGPGPAGVRARADVEVMSPCAGDRHTG